jgi:2,3-bisphosphoglycerate-independent phosphoglycerate mutase
MKNNSYHTPAVLIVLDGWGIRDETTYNAIHDAATPFFDSLMRDYPHARIDASGMAVGLPHGQMGNSEIGHMAIGAGARIDTDLVRIDTAITNNEFVTNHAFVQLFDHVKKYDSTLHVHGLLSPGGIHSHSAHLYAFLRAAKEAGITKIAIHTFLDGRDTPPQSAAQYLRELEDELDDIGIGHIATASGRFYAMDRDNNWDRLLKAEQAIFEGKGTKEYSGQKASEVMCELYEHDIVDEHVEPIVFLDAEGKTYPLEENDGLFFYNFRADRARMLSKKSIEHSSAKNVCFVTLTEYDETFTCPVAFPPFRPTVTLAGEISRAGLTQAHIAETEKYAHATYFLNGGRELPHEGEHFVLVPSRKDVPTHDLAPEMRAHEIADKALEELAAGTDFLFINFANADMVGHTANVPAIKIACETVDRELKRVVEATLAQGGFVFVTADHGNAEQNIDTETGAKHTAHTTNLVPGILTIKGLSLQDGALPDIAPTVLTAMGLPVPVTMTGHSLCIA